MHGAWGHPEDWRWVREDLERAGVQVTAPDLPSHRSAVAGPDHDADIVRQAIRAASEPVVAAGWSYGGAVLSVAAASGDARVAHLVYVAAVPALPDGSPAGLSWLDADPHVHAGDGTTSWTMTGGSTRRPAPRFPQRFGRTWRGTRGAR